MQITGGPSASRPWFSVGAMRPVSNTIRLQSGAFANPTAIAAGEVVVFVSSTTPPSLDNADMRLVHRYVQSSKILHGCSPLHTVEDENVFTVPWSATTTYWRISGDWVERVCAENTDGYYAGLNTAFPTAEKPDF
jgi:hypothetical protein